MLKQDRVYPRIETLSKSEGEGPPLPEQMEGWVKERGRW